jgi:nitrate/nitrite-specific signal transduction histidine kinase
LAIVVLTVGGIAILAAIAYAIRRALDRSRDEESASLREREEARLRRETDEALARDYEMMVQRVVLREHEQARLKCEREQAQVRADALKLIATVDQLREEASCQAANAETAVARAEAEFTSRALAPFWTAVESAANSLAFVDESIRGIAKNREGYCRALMSQGSSPPGSEVDIRCLSSAVETARRMHRIVDAAQKDFQFASIFEQRRTNQLLVYGFGNLASALAEMSSRLEKSLSDLELDVHETTEAVKNIEWRLGAS